MGFMFAPGFHPAMKYAAAPRREIGIRTVFNILGPLTNPAGADAQVLGVAEETMLEIMATALQKLGCRHALVVHGEDGLDEMTTTGRTRICELKDDRITSYEISPEEVGLSRTSLENLKGSSAAENAALLRRILDGAPGPPRDVVLLNAAGILLVGDKVKTLREGLALAQEVVDRGDARRKLDELINFSQSFE